MSRMIKMKLSMFKIIIILIFMLIPAYLYAADIDVNQLGKESEDYFSQDKYDEFLSYLDRIVPEKGSLNEAYCDYYRALTYLKKLNYLDKREDWERYYQMLDKYTGEINAIIAKIGEKFPDERISLECEYLSYLAYSHKDEAKNAAAVLNKIKEKIKAYVEKTKDVDIYKIFADKLYGEGKNREAKQFLNSYIAYLGKINDFVKLKEIGDEYFSKKDYEASGQVHLKYLEAIQASKPEDLAKEGKDLVDRYYNLAWEYECNVEQYNNKKKIYEITAEFCGYLLANNIDNADYIQYKQALSLYGVYRHEEGIKILEELLAKYPDTKLLPEAIEQLGTGYFVLSFKDKDSSIESIQKLIEKYPENLPLPYGTSTLQGLYSNLGNLYMQKGEYEQALAQYRIIFEKYPSHTAVSDKENIITCANKLGKPELADFVKEFEEKRAKEKAEEDAKWQQEMLTHKQEFERSGKEAEARILFHKALKGQDKTLCEQTVKKYEQLVGLYPDNEKEYIRELIVIYGELKNYDAGEKFVKRLLILAPDDKYTYLTLINFYTSRKLNTGLTDKDAELENLIKETIELSPNETLGYIQLFQLYLSQGKKTEAQQLIEEVKKINPEDNMVKTMIEFWDVFKELNVTPEVMQNAELVQQQKSMREKLNLGNATETITKNIDTTIAEVKIMENSIISEYDLMIADGKKAVEAKPKDAEAYLMLGCAYYIKANLSKDENLSKLADEAWQKAIELDSRIKEVIDGIKNKKPLM